MATGATTLTGVSCPRRLRSGTRARRRPRRASGIDDRRAERERGASMSSKPVRMAPSLLRASMRPLALVVATVVWLPAPAAKIRSSTFSGSARWQRSLRCSAGLGTRSARSRSCLVTDLPANGVTVGVAHVDRVGGPQGRQRGDDPPSPDSTHPAHGTSVQLELDTPLRGPARIGRRRPRTRK